MCNLNAKKRNLQLRIQKFYRNIANNVLQIFFFMKNKIYNFTSV